MADLQRIEIDWDTGRTRDLGPVIDRLEAKVAHLERLMKQGYWKEYELITADGGLTAATIECHVTRTVIDKEDRGVI